MLASAQTKYPTPNKTAFSHSVAGTCPRELPPADPVPVAGFGETVEPRESMISTFEISLRKMHLKIVSVKQLNDFHQKSNLGEPRQD
jgi:hypothetical protein